MATLSTSAVAALRARAQREIDEGNVPSCQYALALDGEVMLQETLGEASEAARYAIWSSTKPVFSSVVWQLMSEGLLDPLASVTDLWPEFGQGGKDKVTLEHLLLFTAGFPEATLDLASLDDRGARVEQMQAWTLDWEPGTAFAYHGLSAHHVMAELVERVTGIDWRVALRERVLDPLGLDRLVLGVPADRQQDILPIVDTGEQATAEEFAEALGLPELPPHLLAVLDGAASVSGASPNAPLYDYQQPHVVAAGLPGGGAVSDAASVALFYQHLLHDPKGIWSPEVLRDVTTNVRNTFHGPFGFGANRTRGLEVQGEGRHALHRIGFGSASPETFGHGGAAGQIALADPTIGLSFCYLTNGCDLNGVRSGRRGRELTAAAVACVS
jgi:CubicO group peptidase (beta-lactamase class C family)